MVVANIVFENLKPGKKIRRRHFEIFFSRKYALKFHANCLLRRHNYLSILTLSYLILFFIYIYSHEVECVLYVIFCDLMFYGTWC